MRPLYALQESSVLYDGRRNLILDEVRGAITNAMRRKLRRAGFDAAFWRELRENGESFITWNFTRYNARNDKEWVAFEASVQTDTGYLLNCFGPKAEETIERINKALLDNTPKWLRKMILREKKHKHSRKRRKKKKQRRQETLPKEKRRKEKRQPILCLSQEKLTPQYRNHRLFWLDAAALVAHAFDLPGHNRLQNAWVKLYDSAQRTEFRYAQLERNGFTIRFEFVDARWRGDITPLTVSCTKDNRHPAYRRMRGFLAKKLHGLPLSGQKERNSLLYLPVETKIAA